MKASARAFVQLHDIRESDGGSMFTDNPKIKQATGKDQPIMKKAEPPDCQGALFVWHLYFNRLRGSGISFTEIKSYMDLYGVQLTTWQIDLIFVIHQAVEGYYNDKQRKAMNKNKGNKR